MAPASGNKKMNIDDAHLAEIEPADAPAIDEGKSEILGALPECRYLRRVDRGDAAAGAVQEIGRRPGIDQARVGAECVHQTLFRISGRRERLRRARLRLRAGAAIARRRECPTGRARTNRRSRGR